MNSQTALLCFDPLDTLFFRDGRPYTKDESEQVGVESQFPPSPATLVGAVRAAAARGLGWPGCDAWSENIKHKLGDGPALGPLRFSGPVLLRDKEMLFPAPASLMRDDTAQHTAVLQPGPARNCDLGSAVPLPTLPADAKGNGWKQAGGAWLTLTGFKAVLRGVSPKPDELIEQNKLWSHEARVGIQRNEQTHSTEEGALYSSQHVRLQPKIRLALWVEGLEEEVLDRLKKAPQPVGGESRCAWIKTMDKTPPWPAPPERLEPSKQGLHYTVIVLSPLPLATTPMPGQAIADLPGTLVSACLPRALMLGGWDSVKQRPLALKPHLAPGSVLFMRADTTDKSAIGALHGTRIGERPAWGYGLIAIGTWIGVDS